MFHCRVFGRLRSRLRIPRPLPPAQQLTSFDKTFHIQLATDIFFDDLVTALNPVLLNKTFGEDKKITIRNFSIKGDEERLIVTLATTGDFDGELIVLAKPIYNRQNNTLTFEDVDFDTKKACNFSKATNKNLEIFEVSCRAKGQGLENWYNWLRKTRKTKL